jgi:hypothetical protein
LEELLAQQGATTLDPRFRPAHRQSKSIRQFDLAGIPQFTQRQRLAIAIGKILYENCQERGQEALGNRMLVGLGQVGLLLDRDRYTAPIVIDDRVVRHAKQPRREATIVIDRCQVAMDLHEHLLKDVFGVVLVS